MLEEILIIMKKKLRELHNEIENSKNKEEDNKKYEILYQRDKEMSEFINNYESIR